MSVAAGRWLQIMDESVTGLLGVLLQAKRNGFILLIKPVMEQLIEEADFRVSGELYATVLQTADE